MSNYEQSQKNFNNALAKHRERDYAAAESGYKRAIQLNPHHLDAHYLLGTLYAEKRDWANALKYLKLAEGINPQSQMVQNNLGSVYLMLGQFEKAVSCFRRALEIQPDMPEVHNNLGNTHKRLGMYEQAEANYREAIKLRPGFIDAYYNLGACLRQAKKYQEAIPLLEELLKLSPEHKKAQVELGTCHLKLGQQESAVSIFTRYLDRYPDEENEVRLMLALLNAGEVPEKYPSQLTLKTYQDKAESWDADIVKEESKFLGPGNVKAALEEIALPQERRLEVLDMGCGTGACGFFLREYANKLVGVDLSPHMIRQAEKKALYDKLECADLLEFLAGYPAQFDLITASGVLILFSNLEPIFIAARRLLKDDGWFVFTLYRSESEQVAVRHNLHFAHSPARIREMAQAAGLRVESIKEAIHEYELGVPQPGYIVVLRRPHGALSA